MLRNCRDCGSIFSHSSNRLCPKCTKQKNDQFVLVREYLRENPQAVINDVVIATEVSYDRVREFIDEGRLKLIPADVSMKCQLCSAEIDQGRICQKCAASLKARTANEESTERSKYNARVHLQGKIKQRND